MQVSLLAIAFLIETFFAAPQAPKPPLPAPAGNIVFKSVDGGRSWQDVSAGLPANAHPASIWAGDEDVMLGTDKGVFRGGLAPVMPVWEKDFTLEADIVGIFPGRAGPYALTPWDGFFQARPFLFFWAPMHRALDDQQVFTVLETGAGALLVGCASGIFKSPDYGETWQQVADAGMVTSLTESNGILIGGSSAGVLRSTDGGEHWSRTLAGHGAAVYTRHIREGFVALLREKEANARSLFRSTDNGASWHRMIAPLPPALRSINALEEAGDNLLASCDSGVFRSTDRGKTWALVHPAPPGNGSSFYKLAVSGKAIFAVLISGC